MTQAFADHLVQEALQAHQVLRVLQASVAQSDLSVAAESVARRVLQVRWALVAPRATRATVACEVRRAFVVRKATLALVDLVETRVRKVPVDSLGSRVCVVFQVSQERQACQVLQACVVRVVFLVRGASKAHLAPRVRVALLALRGLVASVV